MAKADSPEAKFLEKLFHNLNDCGLNYAVMRNYELLPNSADGSDLDLLIDPKQERLIMDCIAGSIRSADGIAIGHVNTVGLTKIFACGQPDNKDDQWWGLRLDICKGVVYRGSHNLIEDTVYSEHVKDHHGIKVLSSDLAAVLGVMKEVLHNGVIGDRYIIGASDAATERWHSISTVLSPIGENGLNRLHKICVSRLNGTSLDSEAKQIRCGIECRSLLASPVSYATKKIQYYGSKLLRILHPPGKMIVLLGTDGAGKSTVIEAIKPALMDATHKALLVKHLRPRLFPPLGRIKQKARDEGEVVTDPHGSAPSGYFLSLVRLVYYFLDYTIGYWLLVRPALSKSPAIVLFDRYAYDILLDPKRLRINLPQWVLRIFVSMVPKPDLTICLYGDPEVLASRKNELPVSEVERQVNALVSFSEHGKNRILINTVSTIVETRNHILNSIKDACEQ